MGELERLVGGRDCDPVRMNENRLEADRGKWEPKENLGKFISLFLFQSCCAFYQTQSKIPQSDQHLITHEGPSGAYFHPG